MVLLPKSWMSFRFQTNNSPKKKRKTETYTAPFCVCDRKRCCDKCWVWCIGQPLKKIEQKWGGVSFCWSWYPLFGGFNGHQENAQPFLAGSNLEEAILRIPVNGVCFWVNLWIGTETAGLVGRVYLRCGCVQVLQFIQGGLGWFRACWLSA